ncbi:DUF488 domain-containing protein [Pseudactinotalea sp.]|uniref:DUF488 domain-containing protein n=1 Tax=Pseudactinotalea sp. TaxID=1926260 RepID=UPI003B3A5527
MSSTIRTARVYEDVGDNDGARVLVDRLWPRGMRKDDPRVGTWFPDAAPSTELRRWYQHEVDRFVEFAERYRGELTDEASDAVDHLAEMAAAGPITLTTASKDLEHSEAAVLAEVLRRR